LIGSIAVTVPSAAWLWSQGPQKGEGHGHGGHDEHAEGGGHEEGGEEASKDEGEDKGGDEGEEKPKEDAEEEKDKGGDDKAKGDSEDSGSDDGGAKETPPTSDDEGEDKPESNAPQQINKPSGGKGPGETSKGERSPTEKKGEKDVSSNAPSLNSITLLIRASVLGSTVQIAFRLYVRSVRLKTLLRPSSPLPSQRKGLSACQRSIERSTVNNSC
jgi:hypothetical protein